MLCVNVSTFKWVKGVISQWFEDTWIVAMQRTSSVHHLLYVIHIIENILIEGV